MNPAIDLINAHWNPGSWQPPTERVTYPRVRVLESGKVRVQWHAPPTVLPDDTMRYRALHERRIAEYDKALAASRSDVDLEALVEAAFKALQLEPVRESIAAIGNRMVELQGILDGYRDQRKRLARGSAR